MQAKKKNTDSRSVRPTSEKDLDRVMQIYEEAKQRMRLGGNLTQWVNGYPSKDVILHDMSQGNSYVVEEEGKVIGVFTFIIGEDPTYGVIEGEWPNNLPYGTIHRIASATGSHGVGDTCLRFCTSKEKEIRVDTHADNAPMLGWIASRGFKYCGIIHISDGSPREAFHLSAK